MYFTKKMGGGTPSMLMPIRPKFDVYFHLASSSKQGGPSKAAIYSDGQ